MYTPIECAALTASIPTIKLLLNHNAILSSRQALTIAAYNGRQDVVEFLLDNGADIDEIPDNKDIYDHARKQGIGTALHAAIERDKEDIIRFLLERGARIDLMDSNGLTATELAQKREPNTVVALLNSTR